MLSRRWIINGTLVIVIAMLTLVGLGIDDKPEGGATRGISELGPADINRVEIQSGDALTRLVRRADAWRIEAPIDWPADGANVRRLLSIVDLDADALAQAADVDLTALGLQPPGTRLRFNDTPLLFGTTNNIGERRYVMLESTLYLLPDVHLAFATQGIAGLADRRLLPPPYRIESLRLPDIEISRDGEEGWRASPAAGTSAAALQSLVGNWQALPASRVRRLDADATPRDHIEVRLADGDVIDFLLMSIEPEIVIANPRIGLQYHFRTDYRDQLVAPGRADDDA